MTRFVLLLLVLAACAELPGLRSDPRPGDIPAVAGGLGAPLPPPDARSVEDFDTTTEEQRIAAAAPVAGGQFLGTTVASLGDPVRPGFWIETALATAPGKGRLVYPANGRSVEVELFPIEEGSSRVSLAAFRLLEAPLTGLPVLEVHAH